MTLPARRTLVVLGAAVLLVVATIGIVRATSAPTWTSSSIPAGVSALDDPAGADLDAILAAEQTSAAPAGAVGRGRLRHLAAWRRLVHATVVVDLRQGGLTTVQLDHGTISAVAAGTLTIAEAGGGSVTVALGDETRVRRNGAKAAVADLRTADEVFVMSKVEAGGTTAYLVVVPRT